MKLMAGPPGPFWKNLREKSINDGGKKGMQRRKREAGELEDFNHEK